MSHALRKTHFDCICVHKLCISYLWGKYPPCHRCFRLSRQVVSNLCHHLSFHRPGHLAANFEAHFAILNYKPKDLLSEDIGENPTDHGDDGEEEEEDEVGEEEALDLLDGGEPAKAGEEDHEDGGDEDGVGGVHVKPVP